MGSKKRSAWQKQKAEFAASLGGMDDLFASENARSQRHDEERAAALRHKACERKNRYASSPPPSAPNTAPRPCTSTTAPIAMAGTSPQRGSNQAREHFWCSPQAFRIFRRVSQVSQSFASFAKRGRGPLRGNFLFRAAWRAQRRARRFMAKAMAPAAAAPRARLAMMAKGTRSPVWASRSPSFKPVS